MTLEQAAEKARARRAPEQSYRIGEISVPSASDLAAALRRQDEADRKRHRTIMRVFLPLTVFYAALFVLTWIAPPDTSPALNRLVLALSTLLFLAMFIAARARRDRLAGIDYAAPLRDFLAEAELRCRFITPRQIPSLIGLHAASWLLCFLAIRAAMERYLPQSDSSLSYLLLACIYVAASLAAYVFGRHSWRRNREPLHQRIKDMQAELDAAA